MGSIIDLTGQKFSRLLVIGRDIDRSANQAYWLCRCDCGAEKSILSQHIRRGAVVSCGCHSSQLTADRNRRDGPPEKAIEALRKMSTTHGMSMTAEHRVWSAMRKRCAETAGSRDRAAYYARGIRVCPAWRDFEQFYRDMGPRPPGTSIDRIDNDGNYEPGNCRWATTKEQGRNKRSTKLSQGSVSEIKRLSSLGLSQSAIGEMFGVGQSHISRVLSGEIWS